mgnify:CR=1 FL=1
MDGIEFELGIEEKYDIAEFSELHTEILFYLEDKIIHNTATQDELIKYENYKYFGHIDVDSEVCQKLIEEMQNIYENGCK